MVLNSFDFIIARIRNGNNSKHGETVRHGTRMAVGQTDRQTDNGTNAD